MGRSDISSIAESVMNTLSSAIIVINETFHIVTANQSFYQLFKKQPHTVDGQLLFEVDNKQWDKPMLRTILTSIISSTIIQEKFNIHYTFDSGEITMFKLNIHLLEQMPGKAPLILIYVN
jgi:PAS domain-containing protein